MRSTFSRLSDASQHSLIRSGRRSRGHCPGPVRTRPPFVAITRSSGYGCSASAIRFSETSGPFESAVSIRLTPSSTTRLRTRIDSSWSAGGPQIPGPVMRMAPIAMRRTSMLPRLNVPADCAVVVISQSTPYPYSADRKHCGGDDEVGVALDRAFDADEQHADREDPPRRGRDQLLADQADREDLEAEDPRQRADVERQVPVRLLHRVQRERE